MLTNTAYPTETWVSCGRCGGYYRLGGPHVCPTVFVGPTLAGTYAPPAPEPPLTDEELRALRRLLREQSR